ncbi:class I SAM-dependent methyltransferase [Asanoa sp. WMMD1127]|uniref:class I SAM-dependent methyltransferase n=1 Tax=Asanoa sp. WMMD1127 TaxID=3016107 RepID=UPI002415EF63|nr:class I SAM-dependent methyltransferase [Asanoa sp. WMMD1127]MDG4824828.1 class I SAM-dependent methyltransferase [Asanoa sp. WMMD1127]
MPTLPVHHHREVAESFGVDAERYDRARPRYPAALIERIVATSPGSDLLDVGCGTGIASRQFQAVGCRVLGVEPDPRMAAHARRHGVEVEVAKIEGWDPAGRVFDTVVAAQAWHWVDPRAGAHAAFDVLRPGGRVALFWNAGQPTPDAGTAFAGIAARLVPELPAMPADALAAYGSMADTAAAGLTEAGFEAVEHWRDDWQHTYTRDEWLDVLPTQGIFTRLPADRLGPLLSETGAAIDELGGALTVHYSAVTVTAVRP